MPVPTVDQYGGNFVCRVRRRAGRTEALAEHVKADWQGPGLPNATCFTVVLMRHLHRPAGLAALAVLSHLAEEHLSACSLQDAGDGNIYRLADKLAGMIDDHHGAVVKVADTLVVLLAFFEDEDGHALAGQDYRLEGIGEVVDVEHVDTVQVGHLVQVEVRSEERR